MFLLLAAGFLIGGAALLSEWMGGCSRHCPIWRKKSNVSSSADSRDNLIPTPKSDVESEIKIIPDSSDDLIFDSRNASAGSNDTLEGLLIHVTEESIIVHEGLAVENWDSRRSNSVDLDKEVQEIFDRDHKKRRFQSDGVIDVKETVKKDVAASDRAFGDRVSIQ